MKSSITHAIDGEYIREWLVLGPFFPDDLDKDFIADVGGEASIQPHEGMSLTTPEGKGYTWKRHKSQFEYVNLQDVMKQLLFSIDLKFQSELDDSKKISEELRQVFEDSGLSLSGKATIAIENKGSNWWIIDRDNQQEYIVLKEEEKLDVYIEPRKAFAYVACNLFSPKAQHLEMVLERYDSVKVWVNGSLIHSSPERNRWDTESFGIYLKEGENLCLIKVGQYIGGTEVKWGLNARVLDHDTYVSSLKLELTVRRQNPDGRDERVISAQREPQSTVWKLPALPVQIEIRDEASKLLKTPQAREGESIVWTVPRETQGSIGIAARLTDALGKTYEAGFACQAHSTIAITPQVGQWKTYDVSDGLGSSHMSTIIQDRHGIMWFGGQFEGGVVRYDGRHFRTFTTADGLPNNNIWVIFEDRAGHLWFGTMEFWNKKGAGVCRYDGENFHKYTTKDGLVDDTVLSIYQDGRGHLWFGTAKGISEFDGESFRNYTVDDGLLSDIVAASPRTTRGITGLLIPHGNSGAPVLVATMAILSPTSLRKMGSSATG
jgi:hypothetical protein